MYFRMLKDIYALFIIVLCFIAKNKASPRSKVTFFLKWTIQNWNYLVKLELS